MSWPKGVPRSEETRRKMSEKAQARLKDPAWRLHVAEGTMRGVLRWAAAQEVERADGKAS